MFSLQHLARAHKLWNLGHFGFLRAFRPGFFLCIHRVRVRWPFASRSPYGRNFQQTNSEPELLWVRFRFRAAASSLGGNLTKMMDFMLLLAKPLFLAGIGFSLQIPGWPNPLREYVMSKATKCSMFHYNPRHPVTGKAFNAFKTIQRLGMYALCGN